MTDELAQCFKILDLEPTASPDAVKQAYRELVKIWHPDRFMHDDKLLKRAQAKMKEINVAYETIVEHHACEPPRDFHRASPQPPKPPPSSTASLRTEPAAKARGYLWGKFFGILLFCQPFFLGSLLSNGDEFFFVTAFFGVLYWPVGYFVIKRKRWAVVLGTLI
ncbi:MAG TPA: J domain-containing protein, partial [Verrucomicrobiae bacterium]|nr:J domain-containing protein [Verrucomicrobiae bacterium]